MTDFDEYIQQGEPLKRDKGYAWQTAIGLQAVDGLTPSSYLIDTARRHIEGEISIGEAQRLIKSYYESRTSRKRNNEEEADKVSANIAELLGEQSFAFTVAGLTAIHRRIFNGVFKFAGKIRDYNITKKEWVLRGDTVLYVSAPDIRRAIEYDLEQERAFDYSELNLQQTVSHIAKFVSGLWQIHPFGEGNTRTTAVFTIQYLRSLGFDVENDLFANHSWFFRNALVRANYQNIQKGVQRDESFINLFFRNLLMGERNVLRSRSMLVNAPEELHFESQDRTSTEQPTVQVTEQVASLLFGLAAEQLSLKALMSKIGLKHRPTFIENYINPAMKDGLIKTLHPEKPNHPRQKYLLTVKGLSLYNELKNKN